MEDREKERLLNIIANYLLERYIEEHPDELKAMFEEQIIGVGDLVYWKSEWSAD